MNNEKITQIRLKEYLNYDSDTGIFRWRVSVGRYGRIPAGTIAGSKGNYGNGYIEINFDGFLYKAHRLAWLYMTGSWPKNQIDHINQNRSDNRFANLREATLQQNLQNKTCYKSNTSGHAGVTWHKIIKKWQARIGVNTKRHHLGYFDTIELASQAYKQAKLDMHIYRSKLC